VIISASPDERKVEAVVMMRTLDFSIQEIKEFCRRYQVQELAIFG
jgi:hypothetical protein